MNVQSLFGVTLAKQLINRLALCPSPEEEPELGNLSISQVHWNGFQLTWTATEGAYENFVIQVLESNRLHSTRNLTAPGSSRSVDLSGLRPGTLYTVTLYGITQGYQTKPLSIESSTGTFSHSTDPAEFLPLSNLFLHLQNETHPILI